MNEEQIRALVREALARHLPTASSCAPSASNAPTPPWKSSLAFGRFVALAPTDPDAPCVVEPQVRCHHCGFCQSYGH